MNLTDIKIISKINKKLNKSKEQKEYLDKKQSNKAILSYYNLNDLENNKIFYIKYDIDLNQIDNFKYIKDSSLIEFTYRPTSSVIDELEYYKKIAEIFKILEKHNRTYNINIHVENRELFNQSKVLEYTNNINLIIRTDLNNYTKEEYVEEERKLDSLIENIKNSNLSSYEKYLSVYNIVKQFKEYKENKTNPYAAREIKEILKNEYMVCVGYAKLLTILLDKVNIPCISISASVEDSSFTTFLPFEDRPLLLFGHERNLIKIDDNKYNIHGIYMADATFDNDINIDLYNNIAITYDKLKESDSLERLRFDDYLFDIHSFNEFVEKVNFYLKHEISFKRKIGRVRTFEENLIYVYDYIYKTVLKLLYKLDNRKWKEFMDKYNDMLSIDDLLDKSILEVDKIYSEFLTELGYYILEISNKEIDISTTLGAAKAVKKEINGYSDEEIEKWIDMTKILYHEIEKRSYPYRYNPNETRINYLENKYESKIRVKK